MIRKSLAQRSQEGDQYFRWRGGAVSRIEALFDAVIALAMTLIVVSLEVPKSYDALIDSFRRIPVFAACFCLLVMCWYYHFRFHRRYGLEDFPTAILNMLLLFVILIYVYPLQFLFSLLFQPIFGGGGNVRIDRDQITSLMIVYSAGFTAIFLLYAALHGLAYRRRDALELTPSELVITRFGIWEHLGHSAIGVISIILACLHSKLAPLSGLV